jgi:flagellar protein FlbD
MSGDGSPLARETHTEVPSVILVHRLRGEPLYINADLIESVEASPDTVLTLVDGRRIFVEEPPDAVVDRFVSFRATLLVAADELKSTAGPALTVVPDPNLCDREG